MFKKSIIITILILISFGGVLCYGSFLKEKENNNQVNNSQNQENENQKKNDITKDWKTYNNEEYGFEIKYPKDWKYKIQEKGMGVDYGIDFIDSKNQDNHIFFNLGSASYFIKDVNKHAQKDFKGRDFKIEIKENIVVDGVEGVKYISSYNNPINRKYIAAYWPDEFTNINDDFFVLEVYIKPENKNSETAIIDIFDQMLSTIKFISQ